MIDTSILYVKIFFIKKLEVEFMKTKNNFSKKDILKIINTCIICLLQILILLNYNYIKHPYVAISIIIIGITIFIYSFFRILHLMYKKYTLNHKTN